MSETFWSFPQIDPIIFSVGPLAVRWYGLMYLIGFAFALWMANRRAMKPGSGWTKDEVSDVASLELQLRPSTCAITNLEFT